MLGRCFRFFVFLKYHEVKNYMDERENRGTKEHHDRWLGTERKVQTRPRRRFRPDSRLGGKKSSCGPIYVNKQAQTLTILSALFVEHPWVCQRRVFFFFLSLEFVFIHLFKIIFFEKEFFSASRYVWNILFCFQKNVFIEKINGRAVAIAKQSPNCYREYNYNALLKKFLFKRKKERIDNWKCVDSDGYRSELEFKEISVGAEKLRKCLAFLGLQNLASVQVLI